MIYREEGFEDQLMNRERKVQRQWDDCKIYKARYNERYKEIEINSRVSEYLRKDNLGEGKKKRRGESLVQIKM